LNLRVITVITTIKSRIFGELFFYKYMRIIFCVLLLSSMAAFAQNAPSITASPVSTDKFTDTLINHSLSIVDISPFEWNGAPDVLKPRFGVYMYNNFPADSVKLLTNGKDSILGNRVWQVSPHYSADEAGLLRNDIILRVNGLTLKDSVYGPEDVLNTRISKMYAGDTLHVQILRNGELRVIPVVLLAGKRAPMTFIEPPGLGPVRQNTWLEHTLDSAKLQDKADSIEKQIRVISDMDMNTVPFTARPNPFRLNAITYLQHYPLRVGALSRQIDQSLWNGVIAGPGLAGAIDSAAVQLGCLPTPQEKIIVPTTIEELNKYFSKVQSLLNTAYAPVHAHIDSLAYGLDELLNVDTSWEDAVDTVGDPMLQRAARIKAETRLAGMLGDADKVNFSDLVSAAGMLAALADTNWVRAFAAEIEKHMKPFSAKVPGVDGDVILEWNIPEGRCVIGGAGPNRYYGDFAFIFDLGGDDEYELPPCKPGAFRFVADVSGNDVYQGPMSAGCGIGCVDVLVDCAGNDTYRGQRWSQGAGCLGIGILADFAGDDIYTANWCSQGAAFLGIGLLYDHAGSDHYMSDVYSQGFAYAKGFGMLLENAGNDSYRAGWKYDDSRYPNRAHLSMSQGFGYGMRPWSTGVGTDGGIGVLSDRQGDDVYDADLFSQGGSYWYGLGILHDWKGADRYSAGQYSQGSGIHLSCAALLDDSGDDSYDTYMYLEQGNAHDFSTGCLEDWAGNDTYRAVGAAQGSALNVSFGYLLDSHGNDTYYFKLSDTAQSEGGGNYNQPRHLGGMGLFIDLGHGDDYITEPHIQPGFPVVKTNGILYKDGLPEKK